MFQTKLINLVVQVVHFPKYIKREGTIRMRETKREAGKCVSEKHVNMKVREGYVQLTVTPKSVIREHEATGSFP